MYLLQLFQEDRTETLGLFDSIERGREFLKKIPAYKYEHIQEDGYEWDYEELKYDELRDYELIEHNGHKVPLSKFSFEGDVLINWTEVRNLDLKGEGIIEGSTVVDAYAIDNQFVGQYIKDREEKFKAVKEALEEKGYEVSREWFGSEDGEAILLKGPEMEEFRMLCHMDPIFVDSTLEEILEDLKEIY